MRPPPGTGEEEAERCGGPGCVTARIDSSAHLLSSSQVTARDGLPRAGRFAGSPHLLARSAHVGRVCPQALTLGRGGLAAGALPGVQGSHLGRKGRRLSHLDPPRQRRQDVALLGVSYRHAAAAAGSIGPPRSGGPDGDIWQAPGNPLGPWAHCVGCPGPHLKKGPPALLGHPQSQDDSDSRYGARAWLQGQRLTLSQGTRAGPSPSLGCVVGEQRGPNDTAPEKPPRSPSGPSLAKWRWGAGVLSRGGWHPAVCCHGRCLPAGAGGGVACGCPRTHSQEQKGIGTVKAQR